jgi:hypothetical protein
MQGQSCLWVFKTLHIGTYGCEWRAVAGWFTPRAAPPSSGYCLYAFNLDHLGGCCEPTVNIRRTIRADSVRLCGSYGDGIAR